MIAQNNNNWPHLGKGGCLSKKIKKLSLDEKESLITYPVPAFQEIIGGQFIPWCVRVKKDKLQDTMGIFYDLYMKWKLCQKF